MIRGIKKFKKISARDDLTEQLVCNITGTAPERVLDPTFLAEFPRAELAAKKKPYILFYYCENLPHNILNQIFSYAKEHGLAVYGAGECDKRYSEITVNLMPFEWVEMFRNAEFVFTGTFHGAVFSILNRRQFKVYKPFGFSCLLSFFALFFYLYAYYPSEAGKGWKAAIHTWFTAFKVSSFFRKLFLLVLVTSMILFRTLLNRDLWMNPLSDVMGGWGIWETVNGERQLTTECIENVILMMPFTGMVMWTFDVEKGVVWKSTKLGLIFSVSIEMLQLLLRLGTFQVSDIVYNTLGGMLGGLCYIVGKKVHERLSK